LTGAEIVFHLPAEEHDRFRRMKIYAFYQRLEQLFAPRGARFRLEPRHDQLYAGAELPGDGHLHIVENGRARGAGYLNATLAYFEGYWHLDPQGVLAESRIGTRSADLAAIDQKRASACYAALKDRFSRPRKSRYNQASAVAKLPEGCIAVFLQGPAPQNRGHAHMSYDAMLRAVARGAGGRPVLVKPHPLKPELGLAQIDRVNRDGLGLIPCAANVHDLLAAACVSVSINSATALEGFLHRTPAILFGRSDFHHFVETVRQPDGFAAALATALGRKRNYAKALYWYFELNCLNLAATDFETRVLAAFAEAGFDAARLGISS
jgi:hypothetical protein